MRHKGRSQSFTWDVLAAHSEKQGSVLKQNVFEWKFLVLCPGCRPKHSPEHREACLSRKQVSRENVIYFFNEKVLFIFMSPDKWPSLQIQREKCSKGSILQTKLKTCQTSRCAFHQELLDPGAFPVAPMGMPQLRGREEEFCAEERKPRYTAKMGMVRNATTR